MPDSQTSLTNLSRIFPHRLQRPLWPAKTYPFAVCLALSILFTFGQTAWCNEVETTFQIDPTFLSQLKNRSSYSVAILPMENMSVSPDVAFHFRQRISKQLSAKGYTIVNNELINQKLYSLGVTHPGQLGLLPFEELGTITSADGFLSGVVEQSARQHGGVYNAYVYTCSLKLQDRKGNILWLSLQNRVAKRRFALDPINGLLDIALIKMKGDSRQAVYALADQMLSTLPEGPVQVSVTDPLLDRAQEIPAKTTEQTKNDP